MSHYISNLNAGRPSMCCQGGRGTDSILLAEVNQVSLDSYLMEMFSVRCCHLNITYCRRAHSQCKRILIC